MICKPGPNPLESLAVALAADAVVGKGIGVADLINHLRDDPHRLHSTVRIALHGGLENRRVVVLVDQFEGFSPYQDLRKMLGETLIYGVGWALPTLPVEALRRCRDID